jgi:hypothetical protein
MMIPMICFLQLFIDMIWGMDSMAFGALGTEGPGKFVRDFGSGLGKVCIRTNEHNSHRSLWLTIYVSFRYGIPWRDHPIGYDVLINVFGRGGEKAAFRKAQVLLLFSSRITSTC